MSEELEYGLDYKINYMYEIIENKVVRVDVIKTNVEVTSIEISNQIESIKEIIDGLNKTILQLENDYEIILNLEKEIGK